jgi:hypothetical protein
MIIVVRLLHIVVWRALGVAAAPGDRKKSIVNW